MECSAAFSECSSGGCRCKMGFQRDGEGGCKPIGKNALPKGVLAYQCVNKGEPLMHNEEIVSCSMRAIDARTTLKSRPMSSFPVNSSSTDAPSSTVLPSTEAPTTLSTLQSSGSILGSKENLESTTTMGSPLNASYYDAERDDCDTGYYCVATFEHPSKAGFYQVDDLKKEPFQGFCCPIPDDIRPVCPVGVAHESSAPPDFGCRDCPTDHFCHRDGIATDKEVFQIPLSKSRSVARNLA